MYITDIPKSTSKRLYKIIREVGLNWIEYVENQENNLWNTDGIIKNIIQYAKENINELSITNKYLHSEFMCPDILILKDETENPDKDPDIIIDIRELTIKMLDSEKALNEYLTVGLKYAAGKKFLKKERIYNTEKATQEIMNMIYNLSKECENK